MAVLTKERLEGYGPFVDFLERRPGEEPRLILSVSNDLLYLCCGVTNCHLPFDQHLTIELSDQSISASWRASASCGRRTSPIAGSTTTTSGS